jgi:GT2 family glycosyltransferase
LRVVKLKINIRPHLSPQISNFQFQFLLSLFYFAPSPTLSIFETSFSSMKLSIIIVNYNVRFFLEQCLFSVRNACKGIASEVFVVDNNSVDGSIQMLREKFPEAVVIENKENVGFSKANNQAIALAKGQYILLLNPDTVVEDDTLHKVIQFMDAHPDPAGWA